MKRAGTLNMFIFLLDLTQTHMKDTIGARKGLVGIERFNYDYNPTQNTIMRLKNHNDNRIFQQNAWVQ